MVALVLRGGAERTRRRRRRSQIQCSGRPYAFVVHGLWPQYENGFPEYCQRPSPRLNRNIVSSMLDLMPAPGLIFNEWDKHGTCSGLDSRNYFETIRKARAAIKIPAEYLELSQAKTVAPGEVEEAFIKANPGLSNAAISVTCNRTRLSRGPHLPQQGPAIPRLRGDRAPRLPPRPGDDAADQRWLVQAARAPDARAAFGGALQNRLVHESRLPAGTGAGMPLLLKP